MTSRRNILRIGFAATATALTNSLPIISKAAADEASLPQPKRLLRVFADPNNLPFCNRREEGFENKLATLMRPELNAELQYNWQASSRLFPKGFPRS